MRVGVVACPWCGERGKGPTSFLLCIGAVEVLGVGEVEGGRICARGGQGCVLGVASGGRASFLSSSYKG